MPPKASRRITRANYPVEVATLSSQSLVAEIARRVREDPGLSRALLSAIFPDAAPGVPPSITRISPDPPASPETGTPPLPDPRKLLFSERALLLDIPAIREAIGELTEAGAPSQVILALIYYLATVRTFKPETRHERFVAKLSKMEKQLRQWSKWPLDEDTKRYVQELYEIVAWKRRLRATTTPISGRQRRGDSVETQVLRLLALSLKITTGTPRWRSLLSICKAVMPEEFPATHTVEHLRGRCARYYQDRKVRTELDRLLRDIPVLFPETSSPPA